MENEEYNPKYKPIFHPSKDNIHNFYKEGDLLTSQTFGCKYYHRFFYVKKVNEHDLLIQFLDTKEQDILVPTAVCALVHFGTFTPLLASQL